MCFKMNEALIWFFGMLIGGLIVNLMWRIKEKVEDE